MNIKKIKAAFFGYLVICIPVVITAFSLDASNTVKVLSFFSGVIGVIGRGLNPNDSAYGLVGSTKAALDGAIEYQSKKKKK